MENEHSQESSKSSFLRLLGNTILFSAGMYVGIKIGESVLNYNFPDKFEIPTATAIGSLIANY